MLHEKNILIAQVTHATGLFSSRPGFVWRELVISVTSECARIEVTRADDVQLRAATRVAYVNNG